MSGGQANIPARPTPTAFNCYSPSRPLDWGSLRPELRSSSSIRRLMTLGHAQFEALFAGLDWRRVRSVEAGAPTAIE